jgi:hypothetical protein
MTQSELPGILPRVNEEDRARVEREAAERKAEKRSLAARRGAATRKRRREDAEAQFAVRLVYSMWNRPRNGKSAFKQEKPS